jgi:peptidase M28-like protein
VTVRRRRIRRVLLPVVLLTAAWIAGATAIERRRLAASGGTGQRAPALLDHAALLDEVRLLAAPEMEGRRTATPGGRRARAHLAAAFAAAGLQPVGGAYVHPFAFEHTSVKALFRRDRPFRMRIEDAANVLGTIPGREAASGVIVVSAHYDHLGVRDGVLYPGADDDASGVSVLLALARHLRTAPPRHTVLFAAFDAEELGLRGSRAFMQSPPIPDRIVFDLSLDMVSRNPAGEIVVAGTDPWPATRPIADAAIRDTRLTVHLGHDRPFWQAGLVDDWTLASDHGPFHEAGIPFLYVGVEDHPGYHDPSDTFEHIDQVFFMDAAELVARLFEAADRIL